MKGDFDDDDLDAEREWLLNVDPKFDEVTYPDEDLRDCAEEQYNAWLMRGGDQ